jgi:SAM-dependent methyltransferase
MRTSNQKRQAPRVVYHYRNSISNILHGMTRTSLLKMIDLDEDERPLIVDIGCGGGEFIRYLPSKACLVGLDINKTRVSWAKREVHHADFICADLCHLPFTEGSIDLVVGASILEFIEDLECAVTQIRAVLKRHGIFVVGYPIETIWLKAIIELADRSAGARSVRTWDPLRVLTEDEYRNSPDTHKHRYPTLRLALSNCFSSVRKEKIPFKYLPDFLSIYECALFVKR